MRQIVTALFMVFMVFLVQAQPGREKARQILQKHAATEYEILIRYESLPEKLSRPTKNGGTITSTAGNDIFMYVNFATESSLLASLDVNIHELNHALTNAWFWEWARINRITAGTNFNYYFYIKPGTEFAIDTELNLFPSGVLKDVIPPHLKTFRFDTYIAGNTSTQGHGLLGLLDEFNSYLHGFKTSLLLRDAFLSSADQLKGRNYTDWLMGAGTSMEAYYEFRFFILEYLLYARGQHTELYKNIKNEAWVGKVFNAISEEYYEYIKSWQYEVTEGYITYANKNNIATRSIPGTKIMFGSSESYSGFIVRMEDYYRLFDVLESGRYNILYSELGIKPFRETCFGK
ncbi:MAG: hypothetical protein ACO3FI_04505 [Cyclobacteriaceae bacterium]